MEGRSFWLAALLWLPVGVVASAVLRFGAGAGPAGDGAVWAVALPAVAGSLVPVAPCGLPLALGCRRLWRLGHRRTAWAAWAGLGAVTVAASLVAGLLGPIAIAVYAVAVSVPVWIAWWWMARRG